MTSTTTDTIQSSRARAQEAPRDPAPARGRGRKAIIIVLVVAIVLAALARDWARKLRRSSDDVASGQVATSSLASMNSFSLALLLGGLRGPLAMVLWATSEAQKADRNLEDFDTKVEWIRLLQPEFDTVHIFQVWNKAYNVSVQMASNANKYTTILDALEYARRVEAQRPRNVNMIYQIGSLFFDKLGGASEKAYYKKRVREESKPHPARQRLAKNDPGWRRLELDPVLNEKGMILPELLEPKYPRPAGLPADQEWVDGSELQYLAPYQPFPDGVGAMAFGYNYHKRAQVLQELTKQVHANLSPMVVDSRPALALKAWSEDEQERGRRFEAAALNAVMPEGEARDRELVTANISVEAPLTDPASLPRAIHSYALGSRLANDAIAEYERHLRAYPDRFGPYQSHIENMKALAPLLAGDRDYLQAMLASGESRKALLASAAANYREASKMSLAIVFRYYLTDDVARAVFPAGVTRADLSKLPDEQYLPVYERAMQAIAQQEYDPDAEDRSDYQRWHDRAQARLKRIGG